MIKRQITISNKLGLHARASSKLVLTANQFKSKITIMRGNREANAKSIMTLMMLAASCGTEIMIIADGEDEAEALAVLVQLIDNKFGEIE